MAVTLVTGIFVDRGASTVRVIHLKMGCSGGEGLGGITGSTTQPQASLVSARHGLLPPSMCAAQRRFTKSDMIDYTR